MTPAERKAIKALLPGRVSYTPGSWDKRYARAMAEAAEDQDFAPSDRQWQQIRRIAHRYRRQLPTWAHIALCLDCATELPLAAAPAPEPPMLATLRQS